MTKLEEVARAICVAAGFDPEDDPNATGGPLFTDVAFPEHWRKWHTFLRQARAAIEAVREPSWGMIEAGQDHVTRGDIWQSMIDAILSEGDAAKP